MAELNDAWNQVLSIDSELESYAIKLTPGWAEAIGTAADGAPALPLIVADLVMALRLIEATARLPYTMVMQLKGFVDGYQREQGESTAKKSGTYIAEKLAKELHLPDRSLRNQIAAKCLELAGRWHATKETPPEFAVDDAWREYRDATHFQFALAGSQQICFVATYNAYDDFLMRCMRVALNDAGYRKGNDREFKADFITAFDSATCDACWGKREMQLFRAARHSFAHAGGRETKELKDLEHPFRVEKRRLQFGPHHTINALRIVEKCANIIVAAALANPAFAAPKS